MKLSASDERRDDTHLYRLLSDAQRYWVGYAAKHDGWREANLTIEQATTGDGGLTYTVPGMTQTPLWVILRDGRDGPVMQFGEDYQDADFTAEGAVFRAPNNRPRAFTNGLWARYVKAPSSLSASVQPTLQPDYARELLPYQAAITWCSEGGLRDPGPFIQLLQFRATGNPVLPGDIGLVGQIKTAYPFYGSSNTNDDWKWWRGQGWSG